MNPNRALSPCEQRFLGCVTYSRKVNIAVYIVILAIFIGVMAASGPTGQIKGTVAFCFAGAHFIGIAFYKGWCSPRLEQLDEVQRIDGIGAIGNVARQEKVNFDKAMTRYNPANSQIEGALGARGKYDKIQGKPPFNFKAAGLLKAIMEGEFPHPNPHYLQEAMLWTMDFYVIKYKARNNDRVYVVVLYQKEFIDGFKDAEWYAIGDIAMLFSTPQVTPSVGHISSLKQLVDGNHPSLCLAGNL